MKPLNEKILTLSLVDRNEEAFISAYPKLDTIDNRIMYLNNTLEKALLEGYKGIFLYQNKCSISLGQVHELSDWLASNKDYAAVCTHPNHKELYIPRETLLQTGLFNPLIQPSEVLSEYFRRLIHLGFQIGCFSEKSNITSQLDSNTPHQFIPSEQFSSLPKSLRYSYLSSPIDLEALSRAFQKKIFAPVLLVVYNRPEHTKRVLRDFLLQPESIHTPLYIISDGGGKGVREVRKICQELSYGHPQITLWCQNEHKGLAANVIEGVQQVLSLHDSIIVIEDDLRLSPYFLRWMNDSLQLYADAKQIAHLHGGTFYTSPQLPHNHALRFAGSWGWATWKDRWNTLWEPDGEKLLKEILARPDLRKHFDYGGFMKFTRMLRHQTLGLNNSWAIRWHASLLLNGKLSINSNPPLVSNDGFDGSGTHASADDRYNTGVCPYPLYSLSTSKIPLEEDPKSRKLLLNYYRRTNNKFAKGLFKLKEIIRK